MEAAIKEILTIWTQGGWLMFPLFLLTVFIYYSVLELFFFFFRQDFTRTDAAQVEEWVTNPEQSEDKELSRILEFTQADRDKPSDVQKAFDEVRNSFLPRSNRRIAFLNVLVGTAPLMGLLGTVAGMLNTFSGLANASGETIDLVAGGIAEALITTETGLVIAIPAYIILGRIKQYRDQLEFFLARMESLTLQKIKEEDNDEILIAL
jgi:biopolymer transport protein ExbB